MRISKYRNSRDQFLVLFALSKIALLQLIATFNRDLYGERIDAVNMIYL